MNDNRKTKKQLIQELEDFRRQIAGHEKSDTEHKRAAEVLRNSEEKYRVLFEGSRHGILAADIENGRLIDANPSICRMFGYLKTELLQLNMSDLHPKDFLDRALSEFKSQIRGEKTLTIALPCLRKDGSVFYADISSALQIIQGQEYAVGFFSDVTDRKRAEVALQQAHDELEQRVTARTEELRQANEELQAEITERKRAEKALKALSIKDDLTGLFNRRGFFAVAEQGLKAAQRMGTEMLLIYGDLDNMKRINDTLGHKEGDQALVAISQILKDTFRESDIIARLGGDEFVVLAMNNLETSAEKLINRFEQVLNDHHLRTKRSYNLSMSLGITCFDPKNPSSIDTLLAEADKIMYENKQKKSR